MQNQNSDKIREAFQEWFAGWEFSAFVTLTTPSRAGGYRESSIIVEKQLESLSKAFKRATAIGMACIGVSTVSYEGRCHAHLLALKETGSPFNDEELSLLKRLYRYNADAKPVYDQHTLSGYLAKDEHVSQCREYSIVMCGDDLLKRAQAPEQPLGGIKSLYPQHP